MSSVSDDRPDGDGSADRAGRTPSAAGDLEFDEAWDAAEGAAAAEGGAGAARDVRDPHPSFEDPSER